MCKVLDVPERKKKIKKKTQKLWAENAYKLPYDYEFSLRLTACLATRAGCIATALEAL